MNTKKEFPIMLPIMAGVATILAMVGGFLLAQSGNIAPK
jgi:hypothetical protein